MGSGCGRANGDRSTYLLSPRRLCLRLIIHRATDHGSGCVVGGMDETIPWGSNYPHWELDLLEGKGSERVQAKSGGFPNPSF